MPLTTPEGRELVAHLGLLLERSRKWRILGYAAIMCAGFMSFLVPSTVLERQSSPALVYACSTIWVLGSAVSLVSSIRDRLWGERFTIPLIAAALCGFSAALFWNGQVQPVTLAYGCFFLGFGAFLADRWEEVRALLDGKEVIDRFREGIK
jgi:hypothetical protein